MAALEIKGKTVDQAIFNGLNELGLGIDEVEIEILHDGRGLFGIGKSAIVRMTPKSEITEEMKEKRKSAETKKEAAAEKKNKDHKESPMIRKPEAPTETQTVQTGTVDPSIAEGFLNGLFKKMEVDAHCVTVQNSESDKINIIGSDTAVLIGRRGETLDALQYITGLVINKGKQDFKRIMLDTENYREKREESLVRLANRIAVKVAKTGRKVTLEPMNPYERRILHATLQSNPKVETISEGEEPFRRVVIRTKRRV